MQQKVDLNALRALSSRLKQTDMRLEQQISEMQRTLKALLSRIRSEYPEGYVHTAVEHAEGDLQEVWKLAIRISRQLSKQSSDLNWSAEHYLRTERLLQNLHLQNPLLQATKTASFTAITRFTGNTSTTGPPTKRNLISASETLLSRLKQLWWKFYDGLLMKKLGEYQQGDPRITTFIQTIENGTPLERTEAREKLSVILHAFDEIARSQTAYQVYKQFGNEQNTLAALKNADEQRRVLSELGVSKQWYASGVDLSRQYPNSPLSACGYNPLQDGAKMPAEAELRMAITLGLKNEPYREWAKMNYNEIEQAVKQAAVVREKERQIAEYKRLNDPPTELPDGTLITPKNKENETTYDYFVERIYDPDRTDANLLLEYDTWLNDTYGKTEWRKKVELADRVTYEFASSLIKETIMGGVDTVKFGYKLVVDPQQTTQEILDSAAYLVNNPEVLLEAARTVYKNFEEGTPEERAGMLGSVASVLVPGVSIMKVGKVSQVTGGLQDASKLIDKVQDVNKVFRKPESLADLLPFTTVVTPEGVRMIVPKEIPGQVHRVEAPNGSRGVGIGGTGEPLNKISADSIRKNVNNEILDEMEAKGSHLLEKHVGKTNEELLKRAAQEGVPSTTFSNKSIALKATQENIRKNADLISKWLDNPNSTGYLITKVEHKYPVGRGVDVKNGGNTASKQVTNSLSASQLYLVKDPSMSSGYKIITGYPVFN